MTSHGNGDESAWGASGPAEPGDEQGQRQDIELSELDELPQTPVPLDRFGSRADDERLSLSARLAEEVPDIGVPDVNTEQPFEDDRNADSEPIADAPPGVDAPRPPVGPLIVSDDDAGNDPLDPYGNQDAFADVAPANGMSAEEAAVREVDQNGDSAGD